jgi:DNA polymerase I-like protein with 3'-5' exonuclease and polymerase domains
MPEASFLFPHNEEQLQIACNKIGLLDSKAIAEDTETTGLYPWKDKIIMIQLANNKGGIALEPSDWVVNFMNSILKKKTIVYHNAGFDTAFLYEYLGWLHKDNFHDTQILAHVLDPGVYNTGLEYLATTMLKVPRWKGDIKRSLEDDDINNNDIDKKRLALYGIKDSYYTYLLFSKLWNDIHQPRNRILLPTYMTELSIVPMIVEMEKEGIKFDYEYFEKAREEFRKEAEEIWGHITRILQQYGVSGLNINSNQQLAIFLYDTLKIPCPKLTPKGGRSVDEDTLLKIDHPIVDHLIK